MKNAQLIWICGIEPSDGLRAGRETLTFEIFNEVTRILILKYAFEYKDLDQHFMTARFCEELYKPVYGIPFSLSRVNTVEILY